MGRRERLLVKTRKTGIYKFLSACAVCCGNGVPMEASQRARQISRVGITVGVDYENVKAGAELAGVGDTEGRVVPKSKRACLFSSFSALVHSLYMYSVSLGPANSSRTSATDSRETKKAVVGRGQGEGRGATRAAGARNVGRADEVLLPSHRDPSFMVPCHFNVHPILPSE